MEEIQRKFQFATNHSLKPYTTSIKYLTFLDFPVNKIMSWTAQHFPKQ